MVLPMTMKKKLLLRHILKLAVECRNHVIFLTKIAKIDTLLITKTAEKPYTFWVWHIAI